MQSIIEYTIFSKPYGTGQAYSTSVETFELAGTFELARTFESAGTLRVSILTRNALFSSVPVRLIPTLARSLLNGPQTKYENVSGHP